MAKTQKLLESIAEDDRLLEIARKEIEDVLVKMRDGRLSMLNRNNGLVIRERDGKDSDIIRLGPEDAVRIGLQAIAKHLAKQES